MHALLHGQVRQAAAYNIALLLVLPFLLVHGGRVAHAMAYGRTLESRWMSARLIRLLFVALVAFWVLRNIPIYPFDLLAPHQLAADAP
jgi:hypothetical protein